MSGLESIIATGSDVGAIAAHADYMLTNGDYIEMFVTNETDTTAITIDNAYFFVMAMRVA